MSDPEALHRILRRQLHSCGAAPDAAPDAMAWSRLLLRIDRHYRAVDEERYLLERSMGISEREMSALHNRVSAERAQLEALVAALPQGVVVLDAEGQVLLRNRALERMLGRSPCADQPIRLVDPDGREVPLDHAPTARVQLVTRIGRVPVDVDQVPLDHGRSLYTFTDLRERLEARSALEKARLEALVAQQAERSKARFLARVSHELRTPLNAIIGYAELIEEEGTAEGQAHSDLRRIHDAGRHLLELINDVLDLTKVDAEQLELHPTATDLVDLVTSIVQDHGTLAQDGVVVRVEAQDPGQRWVDPVRLRQCLDNLVANALRYTDHGEVVVGVVPHGPRVHLSVLDTGCGIAPADLERVFEPFQQATGARGGTGLGLAMVKTLTELMHGRVAVESVLGQGSRFTLDLPLRPVAEPRSASG